MYSNCCCSCSFEPEIINIGQSSHKMYRINILNFQESTIILNACIKKVWKLIEGTTYFIFVCKQIQRESILCLSVCLFSFKSQVVYSKKENNATVQYVSYYATETPPPQMINGSGYTYL